MATDKERSGVGRNDGIARTSPQEVFSSVLAEFPKFSRPRNLISLRYFLVIGLMIAGALYGLQLNPWIAAIPAFLLIGVAQYFIAVGMHEAFHSGLFHPKWLNDATGRLSGALLTFDFKLSKKSHLQHHRMYGHKELDPDYQEYLMHSKYGHLGSFLFSVFFRPFLKLIGKHEQIEGVKVLPVRKNSFAAILSILLAQFCILLLFWWTSNWWFYFPFWIAPMVVIPGALIRLRTVGEHAGLKEETPSKENQFIFARSNVEDRRNAKSWVSHFEKFILGPFHFNYHHEHHIRPSVPYHALPYVHDRLKESGHYERYPENLRRTYFGTIREAIRKTQESELEEEESDAGANGRPDPN